MKQPRHITQFYDISKDADIDFFDANLIYDSRTFIDPFLLKNSRIPDEASLFDRFGDYFRYAYDLSLEFSLNRYPRNELKKYLTVHEPKNINMGYSADSNEGHGPSLADKLLGFFIDNTAKRFVKETDAFPDSKYNPASLQVFTTGIGPDGVSDITANLIMDYLISYTQTECRKWNIPLKDDIALDTDGFDFDAMTWKSGGYYTLPENPAKPGEPLILVPKRLLRGLDEVHDNTASKVISILRADENLALKFSSLISKKIDEIDIEEIRSVFKQEKSVHFRYLKLLEEERSEPYDFADDPLNLLADRTYDDYFDDYKGLELKPIEDCQSLKAMTERLLELIDEDFSLRDGWKDAWKGSPLKPETEPVIGRKFRAMGLAFFDHFDDVTFLAESGSGNGYLDFHIIYKDCRIAIELKLLKNNAIKGEVEKYPSYIHGILVQLPQYVELLKAKHAYYVTGQHYNGRLLNKIDHTARKSEIENMRQEIEAKLKSRLGYFISLNYMNINMCQRPSASGA